jgi:coatomer subunit beta'
MWREELKKTNEKAAQALADPEQYENLFSNYQESLKAEEFLVKENSTLLPASAYSSITPNQARNPLEEMKSGKNELTRKESTEDDDDDFEEASVEPETTGEDLASLAKKISEIKMTKTTDDDNDDDVNVDDIDIDDLDTGDVDLDDDDDIDLSD